MSRLALTLLLSLGLAIRVLLLPFPGTPDVGSWKIWAFAGSSDATALYGVGGQPPERRLMHWQGARTGTEYPPLALYEISAVGRVYAAIDPTFVDSPTLTALIKLPGLIAEMAFVAVLLTWGRRRMGDIAAAWTAVAFWLNPAIIINGAGLGYLDAQMAVPATLALAVAAAGSPSVAAAWIVAAILTKAQAILVAPVVALAVLATSARHRTRTLVAFVGTSAAVSAFLILPIVLRGAWPNMLQAMGRLAAHDMVSGNALNVWWIVTWIVRSMASLDLGWWGAFTLPVRILAISRFMEVGYPNPKPIGAVIVCAAIAWVLWRSRRGLPLAGWALAAAWCVATYFMFNAQVHENHAYLSVPLLALASGLVPRVRALFAAWSVMIFFNMSIFYGLGAPWSPAISRTITVIRNLTVIDITVLAAAVNVGLWIWMTRETNRLLTNPTEYLSPDHPSQ